MLTGKLSLSSAINSRMGAQALVQSNAFKNVTLAMTSMDSKQIRWVAPIQWFPCCPYSQAGRSRYVPTTAPVLVNFHGGALLMGTNPEPFFLADWSVPL